MLSPAEVGYDLRLYAEEWETERLRLTRALALRVATKPDSRTIHDIRVACRRLREAIEFFRGVPEVAPLSDVGRAARRMARAVRRLRELDVAVKRLQDLPLPAGGAADKRRKELERSLRARRRTTARKRRKRIAKRAAQLTAAIAESLPLRVRERAVEPDAAREAQLRAFVEGRVSVRRTDVENLFETLRRQGDRMAAGRYAEHLHRIRVAIKHWRYTSEIARAVMPRVLYRPMAQRLRRLQELGGRSQDFTDLARIAEKELLRAEPVRHDRVVLSRIRAARGRAAHEFVEALKSLRPTADVVSAG